MIARGGVQRFSWNYAERTYVGTWNDFRGREICGGGGVDFSSRNAANENISSYLTSLSSNGLHLCEWNRWNVVPIS